MAEEWEVAKEAAVKKGSSASGRAGIGDLEPWRLVECGIRREEEREGRNGRGGGANKGPAVASEKGSIGGG